MITCGWCGIHYNSWQKQCDSCGGPMPPMPGMELGPPPPATPRALPKGFAFRQRFSKNIATILGLAISMFSLLFFLAMLRAKPVVAVLPGLFLLGGLSMLRYGWKTASATLRAFRYGVATEGRIAAIKLDTTQSINSQHPWKVIYHFTADGQQHEGVLISWDSTIASRRTGLPLWVLYVEGDPSQCTLYPPVG
jgi:hypothetical protein